MTKKEDQAEAAEERRERRAAAKAAAAEEQNEPTDEYIVLTEGAIIEGNRFDDGSDEGTVRLPIGHKVVLTAAAALAHQKGGVGLRKAD